MQRVKAEQVIEARQKAGLTQAQAAEVIGYSAKAWQAWELEAQGRQMPKAVFEFFLMRTKK